MFTLVVAHVTDGAGLGFHLWLAQVVFGRGGWSCLDQSRLRTSLDGVFMLLIAVLSILVAAIAFNVWLFCFLGAAMSRGEPVSSSIFTTMRKAGRTALVSFGIGIISTMIFMFSYRDYGSAIS